MEQALNDYDALSDSYVGTHEKPDKKYSMLPTMIEWLDLSPSQTVVDVACGDGFFTKEIAKRAGRVIGIDNSAEQIRKAAANNAQCIDYRVADMFEFDYPQCDRISCPFVLNYVKSPDDLTRLLTKFNRALDKGGKLVCLVDIPTEIVNDRREWGAVKRVHGGALTEGASMDIELYNGDRHLVTLHSNYHERQTIEKSLAAADFRNFSWKSPIVSFKGLQELGIPFWRSYIDSCDVAYIVAQK